MSCLFKDPTGALNTILLCVQHSLGDNTPCQIAVGGGDADDPYSCCDCGLLSITYTDVQMTADTLERSRTNKVTPCNRKSEFEVTVKVSRCTETFKKSAGGLSDGSPVPIEERTTASLTNSAEAWEVYTALSCCTDSKDWDGCDVIPLRYTLDPVRGQCFGYRIVLRVTLKMCCN